MLRRIAFVAGLSLVLSASGRLAAGPDDKTAGGPTTRSIAEMEFAALADAYTAKYQPLYMKSQQAWWDANITGADQAFKRRQEAENALVELHSDRDTFAKLKALREKNQIGDPTLRRMLQVMYRSFLPGQADKELQKKIIELETNLEQTFNTYRGVVDGKPLSENDIRQILSDTKDSALAARAWKTYMAVGEKAAPLVRELVGLRNQLAGQLGFPNYFSLQMHLQEIDEKELWRIFDDLAAMTEQPYAALKTEIDAARAARFGVSQAELRPWHFGDMFFQQPPNLPEDKFSQVYQDKDMLALAKGYYAGLGLPADDILARSDLYEKPGKCPHAFSADLDRSGDIRVLANLKPNLYWMDTLLHELGHSVYDKHVAKDIPFVLRTASHGVTTEGVALMMGAMSKNEEWLQQMLKLAPQQAAELGRAGRENLRQEKLIFCRWAQVVVRFERGMYEKPDQDLARLWWDLKKRYQLLTPPEEVDRPDYAAKIHILTVPVYYHNYMLGDLFAAQVQNYMAVNVVQVKDPMATSFAGRKEAGDYLREKVFAPGNLVSWNELTRRATGEPLSAKYFAEQFVRPAAQTEAAKPAASR